MTTETETTTDDIVETLVACEFCGHDMTPFNPTATAHICRNCLEDIQVGDRDDSER